MRSITKRSQLISPLFLILLVNGLCGGMLYEVGHRMPTWLQVVLIIILIAYPILNIITVLSIPTILIQKDKIIARTFFKHKEIFFKDINKINESNFKNKVYKVGKFYTIHSFKNKGQK